MHREWLYIATAVIVASVFFVASEPETAALLGYFSLACGLFFLVVYTIPAGIRAKRLRKGYPEEPDAVNEHRVHVAVLTAFILIGVAGIETAVRKVGGLWGDPGMIDLHFAFVFLMLASYLLARFLMTGIRDRRRHRYVAYAFCAVYTAAFTTGTILLKEQFPLFSETHTALAAGGFP